MKARDAVRSLKPDPAVQPAGPQAAPCGLHVTGPAVLATAARPYFERLEIEEFHVVLLDVRSRVKAAEMVARGSLGEVAVHPREVFVLAVRERAAAVIALHNHPSGDPEPSAEDLQLTRRLLLAGEVLGIPVLDHLILGEAGRYVALSERGEVPSQRAARGAS